MLQDSHLAPHFVFDAQCLYKFNDTCFVHFIDELWTAEAFWDAQVSEDSEHMGKSSFVNLKNAVWHESFFKLLESIIQISGTGYWFECSDAIQCLLWPLILILSADYEEQCVIALIHGLKGKFLCLICLVPQDEQSIFSHELRLQTSAESEDTLQLACMKKTLKIYLLCDVEWSNLMHFLKVVGVNFNNSLHYKDISKLSSWCRVPSTVHRYINLNIYVGFEVHTEDMITAGIFSTDGEGVTQNYNTKPNEKMYSTVRDIYHNQTNFKDVTAQLNTFLNTFLHSNNISLPYGKHIHLQADNKITGYQYLQVNCESMINWCQCKDLL
ncbi:hypothetical protein BDR06DRAFT_966818 [Suillus hirtellus]|nr:hypothetical protein BDR06DRAFT_966818 [Suillus hirtellus]